MDIDLLKWTDVYKIREKARTVLDSENEYLIDNQLAQFSDYKWEVVDKNTLEVIGVYKDYRYAVKQARYKYKKLIAAIDKILLS